MDKRSLHKRNFFFMTIEGTFIFFGLTFLDTNSVIPVFIDTYTGSLQLAGLASTLKMVFMMLPQLLIGPYVAGIVNMDSFITRIMLIFRPLFLLMLPILFISSNSYVIVGAFLVIFSLYNISEGLLAVPWWDLFSRTIPNERRGKLLGYQQFFSGICGLAGGFIIKITLENNALSNPQKYMVIFGIAGVLTTISALMMIPVKDLPRVANKEKVDLLQYFRKMPHYLNKNKDFIKLCTVQCIAGFTGMAVPFLILFSKKAFSLDDAQVSTLIYIQIIGTLVGGISWGTISHRLGNKYVILLAQLIGVIINILALGSMAVKLSFIPYIMIFLAGTSMGAWLGTMNYLIEVVEEEVRPIYLVLNTIIVFPLSFISYLAGVIAGKWGFAPLFFIGITAGVSAIFTAAIILKSPKHLAALKTNMIEKSS